MLFLTIHIRYNAIPMPNRNNFRNLYRILERLLRHKKDSMFKPISHLIGGSDFHSIRI
ncbi:hypothetical protein [Helicobacter equorum]|uniref:hypothetical protein n=1 Tax=Helicobacter equorum TaxID=361872 RepID=UPI0015F189CB|nr:hypothetical protein [Helicobacter equorum]